ncbi:MAG TPA: hypothetical protein VM029_10055 [Opitutaceae bacterium]|nr:hypothetical protein [Opitutaceae bacterium]
MRVLISALPVVAARVSLAVRLVESTAPLMLVPTEPGVVVSRCAEVLRS